MPSSQAKISTVATFPPGFFLENILALSDDTLLVTVANRKCIYAVPPPTAPGQPRQPCLLHQFEDDAWAMGIISAPNNSSLVYILTTDFLTSGSGAHHLRVLDISNPAAGCHPSKLVQFPPDAKGLNGLTALSDNVLLAADSFASCIWRIDIKIDEKGMPIDAKVTKWMNDPAFAGELVLPDFQPGVNGLKYSKALQKVCFTSTQQRFFGVVDVDPQTLNPASRPKILGNGPQGDDLILDEKFSDGPVAYLTTHRDNSILRIHLEQEKHYSGESMGAYEMIAEGTQNDPQVLGPTSGTWKCGAEGKTAYFNCDGGLKHPFPGESPRYARILRVDFS